MRSKKCAQRRNGEVKPVRKVWYYSLLNTWRKIFLNRSSFFSGNVSSTSHITHRTEYTEEIETTWIDFKALFDGRRKREGRSPSSLYRVISEEMNLGITTLASFYRHQKAPRVTSLDKIIAWVEREGEGRDNEEIDDHSWDHRKGMHINGFGAVHSLPCNLATCIFCCKKI